MKTTFIFVRHAESEARAKHIVQGKGLTVPLTERGKTQARALAEALSRESFDRVFTSTALRAIDTAAPYLAQHPEIVHEAVFLLHERSKGESEGMDKEAFAQKYPEVEAAWSREEDPRPAGGESFADVEARVMPILKEHASAYAGERILYIGHGNVFRVILGCVLGIAPEMRHRLSQDLCHMSVIEYTDDGRWKVTLVNKPLLRE